MASAQSDEEFDAPAPPPAQQEITLPLAVVGPLTPADTKEIGVGQLQGVSLAVDEYNAQHAGSRRIELQIFDDKADADTSANLAATLQTSTALGVIGPVNSRCAKRIIALLNDGSLRLPVVSALATATDLTIDRHNEYFFRANISDRKRVSDLMRALFYPKGAQGDTPPRKLIAFYQKSDRYSEGLLADAEKWLTQQNPSFLAQSFMRAPYDENINLVAAAELVREVAGQTTADDAIVTFGLSADAVVLMQALRERKVNAKLYFIEPDDEVFRQAARQGVPIAGTRLISVWWPDTPQVNSFSEDFKQRFQENAQFSAALAYDAAKIFISAMDQALNQGFSPADPQAFRDQIAANLQSGPGPSADSLVLSGVRTFANGEHPSLSLYKLQYKADGSSIPWNQPLPYEPATGLNKAPRLDPPPLFALGLLVALAIIGSLIREFFRQSPATFRQAMKVMFSPVSLIIDPLIALIVFSCAFLFILITQRQLLETGGDAQLFYLIGSVSIGGISGFLGVRSLFAVARRLGLNFQEDQLLKPA